MAEDSRHTADVVIVGGGIIGCSIALRLAQAKLRAVILDCREPGAEASSAAAGMLAPQGEMIEPRVFSDLCVTSRNLYPQFAEEIEELGGEHVGYRADGSMLLALDDHQVEDLAAVSRLQSAQGFSVQPLTASEVRSRFGEVSPEVRSGLFVPGDHWVDNERLMQGLVRACRRAGVTIKVAHAVRRFRRKGEHVEALEAGGDGSPRATWTAKTYILAAGCWSGELAANLGVRLPLVPCRGQMMEFQTPREIPWVLRAGHHYLVPRPQQRVLLGTTAEYVQFEKAVTAKGLRAILEGGSRLAPLVADLHFIRAWAGLRPDTPDHLPILGYGEISNLVFATGHFRNGILLAPVTAEIISDLVLRGTTTHPVEAYRPTRFASQGLSRSASV